MVLLNSGPFVHLFGIYLAVITHTGHYAQGGWSTVSAWKTEVEGKAAMQGQNHRTMQVHREGVTSQHAGRVNRK